VNKSITDDLILLEILGAPIEALEVDVGKCPNQNPIHDFRSPGHGKRGFPYKKDEESIDQIDGNGNDFNG
jgi:hypothetical protein